MTPPTQSQVILASTSASRNALLRAAGVAFESMAPGVDEDAAKAGLTGEGATPRDVADALAELKAVRVSRRAPGALVIGADQGIQRRDAAHVDLAAALLERGAKLLVDDGVQHHPRCALDLAQDPVELPARTDQGVDVFDGQEVVEAGADRPGHGVEGLAGGVRHQVDVEIGGEAGGGGHGRRPVQRPGTDGFGGCAASRNKSGLRAFAGCLGDNSPATQRSIPARRSL